MAVTKRIHFLEAKPVGTTGVRYYVVFWLDVPSSQWPLYINATYVSPVAAGGELTDIRDGKVLEVFRDFLVGGGISAVSLGALMDAEWATVQTTITNTIRPVIDKLSWRGASAVWSTIPSQPADDVTAPVVSNRSVINILSDRATVTCTTDEPAGTQIAYGVATSSEFTFPAAPSPAPPNMITSHSHTLTGLTASTTYKYRVIAIDAAGNQSASSELTFQTTAAQTGSGLATPPSDTVDTSVPSVAGNTNATNTSEFTTALASGS